MRLLTGPVGRLVLPPHRRLRLVLDGLDQLDPTTRAEVLTTITDITETSVVRVLLTGLPGAVDTALVLPGSGHPILLTPPTPAETATYTATAGVPEHIAGVVTAHARTWLDVGLLTGAVTHNPDADLACVDDLNGLYDALLAPVTAQLRAPAEAVLAVLAAAGSGPVLPAALAAAACTHLHAPMSVAGLRASSLRSLA